MFFRSWNRLKSSGNLPKTGRPTGLNGRRASSQRCRQKIWRRLLTPFSRSYTRWAEIWRWVSELVICGISIGHFFLFVYYLLLFTTRMTAVSVGSSAQNIVMITAKLMIKYSWWRVSCESFLNILKLKFQQHYTWPFYADVPLKMLITCLLITFRRRTGRFWRQVVTRWISSAAPCPSSMTLRTMLCDLAIGPKFRQVIFCQLRFKFNFKSFIFPTGYQHNANHTFINTFLFEVL